LVINIALAPPGWGVKRVAVSLTLDQTQSRVSSNPIVLKNPRTNRSAVLKEYAEDILGDDRLVIEATDGVVFISRLTIQQTGETIFKVARMMTKDRFREMMSSDRKVEWNQ
jgi:hypothetical protein